MPLLSYEFRQEFLKGNLVLFLGAGFVKNYLPAMPLWQDLLKQVFSSLTGDANEIFKYCDAVFDAQGKPTIPSGEYLRLAQRFELGRERLNKRRTDKGEPRIPSIHDLVQRALTDGYDEEQARKSITGKQLIGAKRLPLPTWVTTNFDTFLEDTIFEEGISSGTDVILSRPIRNVDFAARVGGGRTLLKIHGTVTSSDPVGSIVITEEDYHRFLRSDRYIINKLYTLFCEKTVVFLGYSLNDPNVQFIYHEVLFDQKAYGSDEGAESFLQIRPSFFVSREPIREEQKAYYRHKRIQYIENCSIELFFQELTNAFDVFEKGRADVIARITASLPKYLKWYALLDWNTDPTTLNVPDDEKLLSLAEMLDIVELQELYRATGAAPAILDFDPAKLNLVVMGITRVAESWCRNFLGIGRTDILEALLGFLQDRLRVRKSYILRSMIELIGNAVEAFPAVRDLDWFVQRYCRLLIQYDDLYNDWTDYTFSLEQYVRATGMFPLVSPLTRVRVIQGVYRQLSMCGRDRGDSWYTTNRVYDIWHRFNPAAWPLLEAEIKKNGATYKNVQMIEHLKPGGDPKRFLPRE